jgi:hypothetical protein
MNTPELEKLEARPVPDMNCIVIAPIGKMYPIAHVMTPTAQPERLTQREHDTAAYIVRAYNAHEELVKALEELIDVAEAATALDERGDIWERDTLAIERANNALALAHGKEN